MKNRLNYYQLLHVQPDAPVEIIRASYRTLLLKLGQHPDLGGDHWGAVRLNEAYEILTDPAKRAKYDRELLSCSKLTEDAQEKVESPLPFKPLPGLAVYQNYQPILKSYCGFCKNPHHQNISLGVEANCHYCGSPLERVAEILLREVQRRAVKRMLLNKCLIFYTYWPQQGQHGKIHDLSPLGMQILSAAMLLEEQVIKIESAILQATAQVTNCHRYNDAVLHNYASGVKFLTLRLKQHSGTFVSVTA